MAIRSKYANDFTIYDGVAKCKWCDYIYSIGKQKQPSPAPLRFHIKKHHPDRFDLLVKSEKEAEKAKTNSSLFLLKQQNSLKRMMTEIEAKTIECPTNKLPKKNDQLTIVQAFSKYYSSFNFKRFV